MDSKGIYIHIPFCERKCRYCSFVSLPHSQWDGEFVVRYLEAVTLEISRQEDSASPVETLYVGGGTPSLLSPAQIRLLTDLVMKKYCTSPDMEVTMEINPGTVTEDTLRGFAGSGITRISMGAQSIDDEILRRLGRIHSPAEVFQTWENLARCGFAGLSMDLIMGAPGQTVTRWESDIKKIAELRSPHLSIYHLTLEPETPLHAETLGGGVPDLPDEDAQVAMAEITGEILAGQGYSHYEISNFSLSGYECLHNCRYWRGGEYLGFGASAWSYRNRWRFRNVEDPREYIRRIEQGESPVSYAERLSIERQMGEYMMLGLRTAEGVSGNRFLTRFGRDPREVFGPVLEELSGRGHIEVKTGDDEAGCAISVPPLYWAVHNEIAAEFVL